MPPIGIGPSAGATTGTQPITFGDLYADLLNRVRVDTNSSTQVTWAKRYINQANHDFHMVQNWWWAERQGVIQTHDTYTAGNVSIASTARTTLEGQGTSWNTAISGMGFNTFRAGGKIRFGGETDVYVISGVTSDTAATIIDRYVGGQDTATAYALSHANYTYHEDEYAVATDYFRTIDLRIFSSASKIELISPQEFYRFYTRNSNTGKPRVATVITRGWEPSWPSSNTTDWSPRVVLHPAPDDVYQIPYRYITRNLSVSTDGSTAPNMDADSDEPIIPVRYRHVLVLYGLIQWYRDLQDDARMAVAEQQYVDLVKRIAGDANPQQDHPVFRLRRQQYIRNVAGPLAFKSRRYSADTRFDEIRD